MTELDLTNPNPLVAGRLKLMARRQWWVVALAAVVGVVAAAGYIEVQPKRYAATVTVFTGIQPTTSASTGATPISIFPDPGPYVDNNSVTSAAAAAAHLPASSVGISGTVEDNEAQLLITATEPTPGEASLAATAAAKAFAKVWSANLKAQAKAITPQLDSLEAQLASLDALQPKGTGTGATTGTTVPTPLGDEINDVNSNIGILYDQQLGYRLAANSVVLGATSPPTGPVYKSRSKILLIGLGVGILAGAAIGLLRDLARNRLSDPAEVPELGVLPQLGELPLARLPRGQSAPDAFGGRLGENARQLRAGLLTSPGSRAIRSVLVTSAGSGEGKSFVSANLAVASALAGARTVLVCSDFRHPTLERSFGNKMPFTGLAGWLERGSRGEDGAFTPGGGHGHVEVPAMSTSIPGLTIIPSGPVGGNPHDLLSSRDMGELVKRLGEQADLVILDSPPLLAVADPLVLSQYVDATLLVLSVGLSSKSQVKKAMQLLERSRCHTVGFVVNRAPHTGLASYAYARLERPAQAAERPAPAAAQRAATH